MNATELAQVRAATVPTGPEYEDPRGITHRFGIGRTVLFDLLRQGKIRSISLKSRASNVRGKRLVNTASVREFLASLATN